MKNTKYVLLAVAALGLGVASIGCSSSASCADGGVCAAGGAGGGGGGGAGGSGPVLYAVSPGTYCYDILTIAPGFVDGCDSGPDLAVAIPVTYYATAGTTPDGVVVPAGTIEVGTSGSLGRGVINANVATLVRDNNPTLAAPNMACGWHQTDTSSLALTANNAFTLSVSEDQSLFTGATTCAAANMPAPASGSCRSTWTWTLKVDAALTAPACGNSP